MDDTIVTVRFNDVGEARGALNELKRLDRDGQLRVREAAIEEISRDLEPGVTLVVAEIEEPDPDALASALAAIGGTATQRPAEDVFGEARAAEQAAEAADEEARRVLRTQRREDRRAGSDSRRR